MNKLDNKQRVQVVAALVEGNSIRATSRMTGVAQNTIFKLLADLGMACAEYQDKAFRNLTCKKIQCDEIWSFVGAKQKNVPADRKGEFGIGDVWTWVSMDADTKLVPCWLVGPRNTDAAMEFIHDLASRLANRVQLTTDGHRPYLEAVESAFGSEIDYAMLIKIYGATSKKEDTRYSPAECIGCKKEWVAGKPKGSDISTSYIERQNLTMRMSMRRFTRLTNGFSKKIENHAHAIALHYMYYNFVRVHKSLRCTPAMEAGVTSKLWSIEDIIEMALPYLEKAPTKRGPYKRQFQTDPLPKIMLAYRALDEYGAHWICGICSQGDFDTKEAANLCCSQLIARDVPITRAKAMPLTKKQLVERSTPILGLPKVGRSF